VSIDIERRPMLVKSWGLFDQNIGIGQIVEPSRMVSFCAITKGQEDNPIFMSEWQDGRTKMMNYLRAILNSTDVLVTYNGKAFDVKHINTELLDAGLPEPSPFKHIDLLPFVRRKFKFDSNKLSWVAERVRVGKKLDHGVSYFELLDACDSGDEESLAHFREYNIQDTQLNLNLLQEFLDTGWLKL
jgi:uncharacterized protein YprB with RNaseH-like and TPR domain